jgi:hypothetical protein
MSQWWIYTAIRPKPEAMDEKPNRGPYLGVGGAHDADIVNADDAVAELQLGHGCRAVLVDNADEMDDALGWGLARGRTKMGANRGFTGVSGGQPAAATSSRVIWT